MVRMNARLIPTTEKMGLATPLWSDSEFKTLLGEQMDLIVTEKVRQKLTQKYEIHPDKTWSVDECKKVLGASIRKNNVKGIICCYREFSVTLATQQSQRNSELEKQNNELRARISTLTKKLNLKKAGAKTDVGVSQPDNIYPDLQAFFETDVALQSVTDVPVNSVNVEETDSVPPNSSVVQIQTVANALCPKDIERLSQSLPAARTHLTEFRRTLISRWVEAYPTGRATAAHTAKCLVTDFIPRWGLPDCIDSDQGSHFTGQVVKEVSRMLKIKWNLHCPYRPQASGQVDLRNADVDIVSDALIAYCENLTKAEKIITRKNFTDPNCMFCFCVSMQLHISNTEHVLCACNDYKLQELTFKCLNLYFVRVIRTLKGGIEGLQILFYV